MQYENSELSIDFGLLEPLMLDHMVTEIMVNATHPIYVEKRGKLIQTDLRFEQEETLLQLVEHVAAALGRSIAPHAPAADMRLPDGTRFHVVLRPISVTGTALTIRKFPQNPPSWEDLLRWDCLTPKMLEFLRACVATARLNILIAGGTASGKTTVFNLLTGLIPDDERIITAESRCELQVHHSHVVSLEARPAAPDGSGEVTIQDLLGYAMQMRPDRILTGEVQGKEAWDMLHVMTNGYDGSMFTIHSNHAYDALERIEMLATAATGLPLLQIRDRIAQGIDLVLYQQRLRDGKRKITEIIELAGVTNGIVNTNTLFRFVETGHENGMVLGFFETTGIRPSFADRLGLAGDFFEQAQA